MKVLVQIGTKAIRYGLFLLAGLSTSFAGDVVLFSGTQHYPSDEEAIKSVVHFYGLRFVTESADSPVALKAAISRLSAPTTLALIVSHDSLSKLPLKEIQAALRRRTRPIPVLVFGIRAQEDPKQLGVWSNGAVTGCAALASDFRPQVLEVGKEEALVGALAGVKLPAVTVPHCQMQLQNKARTILEARRDGVSTAVLVQIQGHVGETFLVPEMENVDRSWLGDSGSLPQAFSSMAPFILFVSHAAGEYGWHMQAHYANLTIDDAWLTEPYGHLNYSGLLAEMAKHRFHTTIAFIPWNFDRSELGLVSLFRSHPEQFSICMHGNNHDHREFGEYSKNSLQDQVDDLKQGIARMDRFHALTGLPYDRFMVFPHGPAPEQTFAVLKRYEFLGTANSPNVPLGDGLPTDPVYLWRPFTVNYARLPSISRYAAAGGVPRLDVAIHAFFGNPILFYGHQEFFENGIAAFDAFADLVNQRQPDTQWTSLGEIARHLYLIRRRQDRDFDVSMLSDEVELSNPTDRVAVFHITREDDSGSFVVDEAPVTFEHYGNTISLRLVVPAQQTKKVQISYQRDLNLAGVDISKRELRVLLLRQISDFRDIYLSRSPWGSRLIRLYYRRGWNRNEAQFEGELLIGLLLLGLVAGSIVYRRLRFAKRARKHAESGRKNSEENVAQQRSIQIVRPADASAVSENAQARPSYPVHDSANTVSLRQHQDS